MRKVTRDVDEDVRDGVRALANTEAFQQSSRERKKVEMRFAHMKRILRLDRLRLRGLSGARDEVLLTATAQNLRRLVKLLSRSATAGSCLPSLGVLRPGRRNSLNGRTDKGWRTSPAAKRNRVLQQIGWKADIICSL